MNLSLQKNQAEYQMVNVQLQRRTNNIKLNELTIDELCDEKTKKLVHEKVWKGVGKAFVTMKGEDYIEELTKENKDLKEEIRALEIKKNYVETTLNNTVDGMTKIFQKK